MKFYNLIVIYIILILSVSCSAGEIPAETNIREPAVAGAFYPGKAGALKSIINEYLSKVPEKDIKGTLIALIEPHAGYGYSGQVAAHGYKLLKGRKYDTIVLIGSSHRRQLEGVAVYNEGYWKTPLGNVKVNSQVASDIIKNNNCDYIKAVFEKEHSLEVEVPFLQVVLKDFSIVPVLVNSPSPELCRSLAATIVKAIKNTNTLIVCSTDMSHYHSYDEAVSMDRLIAGDIECFDVDKLFGHIIDGKGELCGTAAVMVTMYAAKELGADKIELLKYANSGDVSGDKSRVVGYGAFAITSRGNCFINAGAGPEIGKGDNMLNEKQQAELIKIARDTLNSFIGQKKDFKAVADDPELKEKRGVFVTLNKHGSLRGCIGYIMPTEELYKAVNKMAVQSSTQDYRFHPVTADELDDIEIEISVLTVPAQISSIDEIEMGKHGVIIKRGMNQGVFLPQVATETGWTKEQFLTRLSADKAGLAPDAWKDKDTEIYTFSAQVFKEKK